MGARILVADDSVTIQKVVELTFSKEDFVLVQARGGEEAIRKAKEARPDLVLLDLVMPDKNGYEVCAALRADPTLRAVPIILLVGTFETFDKEQGLRAGADDFVTKPFESQVLISKVKQLLFARMMEKGVPSPARGEAPSQAAGPPEAPAPSAEPKHPVPGAGFDLPPPTEEISQDRLWQLLEASEVTPPPGVAAPPELSLESLTEPAPPTGAEEAHPEIPLLELGAVAPGAAEGQKVAPAAARLPESLSLEDLLQSPPPAPAGDVAPLLEEEPSPVFDLSAHLEAPPLPMSEVAEGDTAGMAFEDLLGETAAAGAEDATAPPAERIEERAIPSGDLAPPAEPLAGAPEPAAPLGIPLMAEEATTAEAGVAGAEEAATASVAAPVEELPLWAKAETGLPVTEEGRAGGPPIPEAAVASMRDAVTERVAHELARDLTEKLVERIERIVWEVVPDLAEILITKEIERIRAMAQDKKAS